MTSYSIIKKLQLEGATRLDAEYYQLEYLKLVNKLFLLKSKLLSDIAIIRSGTTPKDRDDNQKDGVILLKTTDIRNNILAEENGYYYISQEIDSRMKQTKLASRDVLINIVGATLGVIGRTAFIPSYFPEANITQAMACVRLKNELFLPEFIFIFLTSKFGRLQMDRIARPTEQYNLNLEELGSLKIPSLEIGMQWDIKNIVDNFTEELQESQKMYLDAEKLLLEELGFRNFDIDEKLFSIVDLSDVRSAGRMDAEYFQVKYERLVEKIRRKSAEKLGNLVSMKKGIEVGAEKYQEEGKLFIRVSSLSKNGITESDQKYLSDKLYDELKDEFEPKKGEVLLTKDATLGIAYFLKEDVEGIVSSGVLRLQLKADVEGEYLALCLNSLVGQMQAERDAGGSIIAHWKPEQIRNIFIPILPKETQIKISDLVRKSHEARKKAKELFDEAKQMVEEMVESSY